MNQFDTSSMIIVAYGDNCLPFTDFLLKEILCRDGTKLTEPREGFDLYRSGGNGSIKANPPNPNSKAGEGLLRT
jgi:hypothetical protein